MTFMFLRYFNFIKLQKRDVFFTSIKLVSQKRIENYLLIFLVSYRNHRFEFDSKTQIISLKT